MNLSAADGHFSSQVGPVGGEWPVNPQSRGAARRRRDVADEPRAIIDCKEEIAAEANRLKGRVEDLTETIETSRTSTDTGGEESH